MWKKAVGILLALSVAGAFFYYGLTQAHAADDDWTIGVTRTVHHAFVCQNKEAAESVAKIVHEQTFEEVTNNRTTRRWWSTSPPRSARGSLEFGSNRCRCPTTTR